MARRTTAYEFLVFGEDGAISEVGKAEYHRLSGDSAARSKAGSIAKRTNGPVDLAYEGNEAWEERYITTASPSEYHTAGYRCERLT